MTPPSRATRRALLAGALAAVAVADTESADDEIKALIAKYAAAADGADTNLASQVWLNSPDVSLIYPLGHVQGWEAVKRDLNVNAMGGMFSERKLSIRNVAVHVCDNCAWAEFSWNFKAKRKGSGAPVETNGMETQIYHRQTNRWALVHVHYSAALGGNREVTSSSASSRLAIRPSS